MTQASFAAHPAHTPSLRTAIAELWHALTSDIVGTYRPERHYMRGPGPKWHEKHDHVTAPAATDVGFDGFKRA